MLTVGGAMTGKEPGGRFERGSALEVLRVFLRLGVSSFGGPIAHIGYFRDEFVTRRRWLDEQAYADLVALCQFLPGPASSQVGFSIGLMRAGYLGGLAAWTGFTLPSAIALLLFAYGVGSLGGPAGTGLLHGLKLVAVAIVAQAVWGMARSLCPDRERASIAAVAAVIILFSSSSVAQIAAILLGAVVGLVLCRAAPPPAEGHVAMPVSRRAGACALAAFSILLACVLLLAGRLPSQGLDLFAAFYRSGALVFGGGHVVLPLLREAFVTPGWIGDDAFLAGYGAAQAVPGPLFTFSAYLGALVTPQPHGVAGAALGLLGIFLPGILILIGTLPFWEAFRRRPGAQAAMRGVNAAVVGLLGAALYDPVWTSSVKAPGDFAVALVGFVLLVAWRAPPLIVVLVSAGAGIALALV
jgi:chromate transporter